MGTPNCPLCQQQTITPFYADKRRPYLRCSFCALVFVPQPYWLSVDEEKAEYDLHKNSVADQSYRKFLSRLTTPLLEKLAPKQTGLDFGCGPGPALAAMLEEQGHHVELFDIYFRNDPALLSKQYDFICATEVVEHLREPKKEFNNLFSMLKFGGWLGLMTKLVIDRQAFGNWHYIRDLTHICFYSHQTFEYLANQFNAELHSAASDVILLRKKTPHSPEKQA